MGKPSGSQGRKDPVVGLADVEQDRQLGLFGNLQLVFEKFPLGCMISACNMIIEAYFSDGHQFLTAGQSRQSGLRSLTCVEA